MAMAAENRKAKARLDGEPKTYKFCPECARRVTPVKWGKKEFILVNRMVERSKCGHCGKTRHVDEYELREVRG